jgi:hypothetical protein
LPALPDDGVPVARAEDIAAKPDGMTDQLPVGGIRQGGDERRIRKTAPKIQSEPAILALRILVNNADAELQEVLAQVCVARERKLLQRLGRPDEVP